MQKKKKNKKKGRQGEHMKIGLPSEKNHLIIRDEKGRFLKTGGKPLRFKTPEQLEDEIEQYFQSCFTKEYIKDKEGNIVDTRMVQVKPFTIMGLCMALNIERETLLRYGKNERYYDIIFKARQVVQDYVENRLLTSSNQSGAMFWLKNNAGYSDKHEVEQNITSNVSLSDLYKKASVIDIDVVESEDISEDEKGQIVSSE